MQIFTAKGDRGNTSLLFGGRIRKSDLRIECLGSLDELNSFLGLAKSSIKASLLKELINKIQFDIYIISSEVATKSNALNKLQYRLNKKRISYLEENIYKLVKKIKLEGCCFFIPGGNFSSATLDVCRTVCRRAERKLVLLNSKFRIKNPFVMPYINRLSSLLFVLARAKDMRRKKFSVK